VPFCVFDTHISYFAAPATAHQDILTCDEPAFAAFTPVTLATVGVTSCGLEKSPYTLLPLTVAYATTL